MLHLAMLGLVIVIAGKQPIRFFATFGASIFAGWLGLELLDFLSEHTLQNFENLQLPLQVSVIVQAILLLLLVLALAGEILRYVRLDPLGKALTRRK